MFCTVYAYNKGRRYIMAKHNRRYKDSVFVDLFGEDNCPTRYVLVPCWTTSFLQKLASL